MTFTTDTEADILAISFPTHGNYDGGEILDAAGVVLEYNANNEVMRIEVLHYHSKMPALIPFITALLGMEATNTTSFTREDILRFLKMSQLIPVREWFTPQTVAA
jgi:hypothetical protein